MLGTFLDLPGGGSGLQSSSTPRFTVELYFY
jgi:hypothetical protein